MSNIYYYMNEDNMNENEKGVKEYNWKNCYSASNNSNFNYPPLMNDSRIWSNWQPDSIVNQRIQQQEGIKTNWKYRQYLQQNAIQIMNYNSIETCHTLGLDPHIKTDRTPSSNVPYKFKGIFDRSKPSYGYCNSDLKNPYLTKEQLNARLMSPSISTTNYYTK